MASGYHEEGTYVKMRRNVRKKITLSFQHYEIRVRAYCITKQNRDTRFESILNTIKISVLKRMFIRDEILFELKKIKDIIEADLEIDVYAVYGTETYHGEYKRYLGELQFFMSGIDNYEQTTYRHKNSSAYFQHPEKSKFIPERL